jgi:hypothetical protein
MIVVERDAFLARAEGEARAPRPPGGEIRKIAASSNQCGMLESENSMLTAFPHPGS